MIGHVDVPEIVCPWCGSWNTDADEDDPEFEAVSRCLECDREFEWRKTIKWTTKKVGDE